MPRTTIKSKSNNKKEKLTNKQDVTNYAWNPSNYRYYPSFGYHKSFPVDHAITNNHLPITINKKYKAPIKRKDSYVVICTYPQCINTKWNRWNNRRPFYKFNKNHHRPCHGHKEYRLQIVSRLFLTKYTYKQEYSLVNHTQKFNGHYIYKIPKTKCFITKTNRTVKIMHHILDFLPPKYNKRWYLCKKPLDVHLIRDLIHWCSQSPSVWMKHPKLLQISPHYTPSYDQSQIDRHILRQKRAQLPPQVPNVNAIQSQSQSLSSSNSVNSSQNGNTIESLVFVKSVRYLFFFFQTQIDI